MHEKWGWTLQYPINLASQILKQARVDYVESTKICRKYRINEKSYARYCKRIHKLTKEQAFRKKNGLPKDEAKTKELRELRRKRNAWEMKKHVENFLHDDSPKSTFTILKLAMPDITAETILKEWDRQSRKKKKGAKKNDIRTDSKSE